MIYFKVVRKNLKSVGLLGAFPLQYTTGKWIKPLEPLSPHQKKGGGLWVVKRKGDAFRIKKYLFRKHRIGKTKIFECKIGRILFESSYRIKTAKVFLLNELK